MDLYKVEEFGIQNIVAIADLEHPVDLYKLAKAYPHLEYRPDEVEVARIYLRGQAKGMYMIFPSGRMTITSRTERRIRIGIKRIKRLLEESGFPVANRVRYKISTITGSGNFNEGLDCGSLKAIFPDSKKAFGEGVRFDADGGKFTIYPSGKIVGIGFKSQKAMNEKLNEVVNRINSNLERIEEAKIKYCTIERGDPLIRSFYDYIKKASSYGINFTDEERLVGRSHLEEFLKRKSKVKDNLGATPETLAAGELYLLSLVINKTFPDQYGDRKKVSQRVVAKITKRTKPTVRSGYKIIRNTLEDLFEPRWWMKS